MSPPSYDARPSPASSASSRSSLKEMVSSHRSARRNMSKSSHGMPGMSAFASSYMAAKSSKAGIHSGGRSRGGVIDLTVGTPSPCAANKIAANASSSKIILDLASSPSAPSPHHSQQQQQKRRIDPSTLNADQKSASEYIFSGGNAFLTGAAGVGKSYLLNYVIRGLRAKHERATAGGGGGGTGLRPTKPRPDAAVVVAAATGIAATHIDGVTIHSWAGVRLGTGGARVLVPRVLKNAAACQRWRTAKVLVLDEVSMIDGMFFEALDAVGREVRRCRSRPFGGIQLVLSGDFFQLPPVSLRTCGFAFECPAWSNAAVRMVELRTVVRQLGDQTFVNLLNRIRLGKCPDDITRALQSCHISRKAPPADGIVPTKLYCTNRNVDEENDRKLKQLPGIERAFRATDEFKGAYTNEVRRNISQTMDKKVPSELRLKVGAQVILTRNMPTHNLVNGSRGVVKDFREEGGGDGVGRAAGESRDGGRTLLPVVRFSNGVRMTVTEESVYQGGPSGGMVRSQLPLKLGWSLTVHKSQGMTIERAELQLDDAFDFGQAYVALSRVTSLDGLWVRGGSITQHVVKAHPKVIAFYRKNGSAVVEGC
mmetsp:Transcript_59082/g.125517  ORF Transcript_59082/g.125517 Transcript_59082/m.125517 type:complete len:595 (+) Transcript_59082:402-2186(+)